MNKYKFGEVHTDFRLINQMLDIIPPKIYQNPKLKWLDPCSGKGNFMICLLRRLMDSLKIPSRRDRMRHIILKMLFMVEINKRRIEDLKNEFGRKANIASQDFLTYKKKVDIIIGNPPFNINGIKKVPTNTTLLKKNDGMTIWHQFIKHSIDLLKNKGYLVMIVPSIWMRPDRAKMFDYILQYNIQFIHCFSNTETNKLFHGKAQTPTCFFLLQKSPTLKYTTLYDSQMKRYINWVLDRPLPVFAASIFKKLQKFVDTFGHIRVIKTNMPPKNLIISLKQTDITPYPNISSCLLDDNQPYLKINYTNKKLAFAGKIKLVLAHKMYGFPFIDFTGKYGISNRDNYIIFANNYYNYYILRNFLSTRFARYLFEGGRYRMKFLDKHIFNLIPNIIHFWPKNMVVTDATVANFFHLDHAEKMAVMQQHTKSYQLCVEKGH